MLLGGHVDMRDAVRQAGACEPTLCRMFTSSPAAPPFELRWRVQCGGMSRQRMVAPCVEPGLAARAGSCGSGDGARRARFPREMAASARDRRLEGRRRACSSPPELAESAWDRRSVQAWGWRRIGIRPNLVSVFRQRRGLWVARTGVLRRGGDGVGMVEAAVEWRS